MIYLTKKSLGIIDKSKKSKKFVALIKDTNDQAGKQHIYRSIFCLYTSIYTYTMFMNGSTEHRIDIVTKLL
jgi:hypothetical protein